MIHYITISSQGATKEIIFSLRIYNYLPKSTAMLVTVVVCFIVLFCLVGLVSLVCFFFFVFLFFCSCFCFLIRAYERYQVREHQRQCTLPIIVEEKCRYRTGTGCANFHIQPSQCTSIPCPAGGTEILDIPLRPIKGMEKATTELMTDFNKWI